MQREIDEMNAAISGRRGATIMTMGMREPSFKNVLPMHIGKASVMKDAAMFAIGFDPHQVAVFGDSLTSWVDRQDFDGDIRFMGLISQPALAAAVRAQMAPQTAGHMKAFFELFETSAGKLGSLGLEE